MSKTFKLAVGALLIGAATVASAQTQSQAQSFADQFKQMQSLQSFGTYTFKPAPTAKNLADDPVPSQSFNDRFGQMQSLQSFGTYTFKPAPVLTTQPADSVGRDSFADTFARMQAVSSNSGEYRLPPGRDTPAFASIDRPPVTSSTQAPVAILRNSGSTTSYAN